VEAQTHLILVSEKPIYKTDIPIMYICQKQTPKRGVLFQEPILGNKFHWQLGQIKKDSVLPQPAANLCENCLSCNVHDKDRRTGRLLSSVLMILIAHEK
jgi:hypothetical protein